MWKEYDTKGKLIKSVNYIYPKQKEDTENPFTYIIVSEYYKNGKPKWEKKYKNFVFYESADRVEEAEVLGVWKYYNEDGTLSRTERK